MKFTITFPSSPPAKVPTLPRELLASVLLGTFVFTVIVLLVAPFFVKLLIFVCIAGVLFGSYKIFMLSVEPEWTPLMASFFNPGIDAFKQNNIEMQRGQLTYLWNYGSVPVSFKQSAVIDSQWNDQAIVIIEDTDYKKLFLKAFQK